MTSGKQNLKRVKLEVNPFPGAKEVFIDRGEKVYIQEDTGVLNFGSDGTKSWVVYDVTKLGTQTGIWIDNLSLVGSGTLEDPIRYVRGGLSGEASPKAVGVPSESGTGYTVYFDTKDFTNYFYNEYDDSGSQISGETILPPVGLANSRYSTQLEFGEFVVHGDMLTNEQSLKATLIPEEGKLPDPSIVYKNYASAFGFLKGEGVLVRNVDELGTIESVDTVNVLGKGTESDPLRIQFVKREVIEPLELIVVEETTTTTEVPTTTEATTTTVVEETTTTTTV